MEKNSLEFRSVGGGADAKTAGPQVLRPQNVIACERVTRRRFEVWIGIRLGFCFDTSQEWPAVSSIYERAKLLQLKVAHRKQVHP